jgi:hypothetical protein
MSSIKRERLRRDKEIVMKNTNRRIKMECIKDACNCIIFLVVLRVLLYTTLIPYERP